MRSSATPPKPETVPCTTCGAPTKMLYTKLCHPCWEIESHLDAYLRAGGETARAFVTAALEKHDRIVKGVP